MTKTSGIHHITAITSDPQKNLDFYEGFLGQRLVKKTVNFDDPNAYHLYYGDAVGTPGTILTFFYWAGIPKGQRGSGETASIYYAIAPEAVEYWKSRANEFSIAIEETVLPFGETVLMLKDPDELIIGLVASPIDSAVTHWADGPIPEAYSLRGFYGALFSLPEYTPFEPVLTEALGYSRVETKQGITRYEATNWPGKYVATQELPVAARAIQGAGSIHHVAFAATNDEEREALRAQAIQTNLQPTGMIDRQYFHSTYFMTPAGILFEIATEDIGFTINEPVEQLGEHLQLPPQYEAHRSEIEKELVPLSLPRHNAWNQ